MAGEGGVMKTVLPLVALLVGLLGIAAPFILSGRLGGPRRKLAAWGLAFFLMLCASCVVFMAPVFLATFQKAVPLGPLMLVVYGAAALAAWAVTGFIALMSSPAAGKAPTLHELAARPDGFDRANLEGAATLEEAHASGLLIEGTKLGKPDAFGRKHGWPDETKHPDRLVLGRFYDAQGHTMWYVAPHITRLNQTLVVAPPGSGKTFSFAVPWSLALPTAGHSAFVVDVKGNLYAKVKDRMAPGQVAYCFDPTDPARSLHWNPFDEIDRKDYDSHAFYQSVNDLAEAVHGKVSEGVYSYFETLDQRAIKAGVLLLCLSHEHPTLRDLYDLFDSEATLKTALDFLEQRVEKEPGLERHAREVRRDLDFLFSSKRKDFSESVAGIRNKLEVLGSPAVAAVTDKSEGFTLKDLNERPGLFICAAPLSLGRTGSTLAAVVLRMVARMMVNRFAAQNPRKLFLILDEFSKLQMDHGQVEQFISTSREAGCVSVVFLQDVTQVSPEARGALLANCKDRFILRGAGPETAKWGVDVLGERVRYQVSTGQSDNRAGLFGIHQSAGSSVSVTEQSVPVIKPREIMSTGGLQWGAWAILSDYCPKPVLINLERQEG